MLKAEQARMYRQLGCDLKTSSYGYNSSDSDLALVRENNKMS